MRIGAIVRCDNTGLGIQSKEFFDHIRCDKVLVIDSSSFKSGPQNHHWYPGQRLLRLTRGGNGCIPLVIKSRFLQDLDVLVTFETPYDHTIFTQCKRLGIKTMLQLNYEFLEYPSALPTPDLFLAPSMWHYDDIPDPKVFLPVPVNVNHFTPVRKQNTFVHIVGTKAVHDRNGTLTFLKALRYVRNPITVIIQNQMNEPLPIAGIPLNVKVLMNGQNKKNYYDNYCGGVLVLPRKYGGLSLPCNEAIAAEMPVIMPNISPNNTWLPAEWLVPATSAGEFVCKRKIEYFETDAMLLAKKMDEFCDRDFYEAAVLKAKEIKEKISWEAMLPEYRRVLNLNT